jgi:tight adherence protein B
MGMALVVAVAAVTALGTPAGADETLAVVASDVTGHPNVKLVVAAPPPLAGQTLDASAFRVTEGGKPVPAQVEALPAEQLEVALVVDTSGSMSGAPLAAAKGAAQSFLNQLPPTVPVAVVGFGAAPAVVSPRSTDRAAQLSAVANLRAAGETALYDALQLGTSQLPAGTGAGARRVIVLLSDGGDTTSRASLAATTRALADARIPLFAIELRTAEANPAALSTLTTAGGMVVAASDPAAVGGAFDAIAKQLVRQYAVSWQSTGRGPTDVEVVLETQGVRAVAQHRLEVPGGAAAAPEARPDTPAPTTARSDWVGSWALVGGVALCGLAMLALLLALLGQRAPRVRTLPAGRGRQGGLAQAADRAEALGDRMLGRDSRSALSGALEAAGMDLRPGEFLIGAAAAAVLVLVAASLVLGLLAGVIAAVFVPLVARMGLDQLARHRRTKFSEQLADTLQLLSGNLRAGHGLAQAIDTVGREAESPTGEEFRRLTVETRLGRDFVEALSALSDRVGSEDFAWAVQAIEIQREVGGDLAEVLDTVAGTIRDRTRIRRQVAALSAEGRISAWVLMVLPFALAGVVSATNPAYLDPLFESAIGYVLMAVGAALLVVGGLWLRRIIKPIF